MNVIILSLIFANLVLWVPSIITSLLLIEIGASFNLPVSVAGQVNTGAYMASVVMGLLMGVLSVRYRHKSLLVMGLLVLGFGALSCFFAPTFSLFLVCYSVIGLSTAIVAPMSTALIGDYFSVDERPRVIGYILAGSAVSYVIGSPLVGYIGDWRLSFLLCVLPLALISVGLAIVGLPSSSYITGNAHSYFQGYRAVMANKSAIACLVANLLTMIASSALGVYGIPFYRETFHLPTQLLAFLITGVSLTYALGSLIGGRLVHRFGSKPLTVVNTLLFGLLVASFINMPNVWASLILWFLGAASGSLRISAYNTLALEQVPAYRGTMMALSQLSQNLALALGTSIGGLILGTMDYRVLGVLGIPALIASSIFYFLTVDPSTPQNQ